MYTHLLSFAYQPYIPSQHILTIPTMWFQGPMTQNMVKITIRRISTPKYSVRKITLRYQTPTSNQKCGHLCAWFNGKQKQLIFYLVNGG